ncbi:DUF3238 domain-containing protein [Streptomyces sp. NBC_00344]|uniref:DUF3238 domain-containing protein n=1 Tax=Streptomyces sp. NBC_00344 TaxID=2975720 RepID=UPI002E1EBDCD
MTMARSAAKASSLAVLPLALLAAGFPASANAGSDPTPRPSGFSISALDSQSLTDVTGVSAQSTEGKALKAQGFSVMRTASGETAVLDRSMADEGIVAAAGRSFVDISWKGYAKNARYVVTRDEKTVATLAPGANAFHDTSVTPGSDYQYIVTPVLPKGGDSSKARKFGMKVSVPSATPGKTSLTAMREQAVSRAEAATVAKTTTLTWVAFIPQKRIDAPPAGCDYGRGYQFAGDGHSDFNWKSSQYRTSLNAVITWGSKSVAGYKDVRASHVYKKSTGKLVSTKTASSKNMVAKKMGSGSNSVDVRMVMHASNPFCHVGAIDGALQMHLTKSGNWSIHSGTHRLMPDHYIYIYDGGKVTSVYKRKYASAACLIGSAACPVADLTGYYGTFS